MYIPVLRISTKQAGGSIQWVNSFQIKFFLHFFIAHSYSITGAPVFTEEVDGGRTPVHTTVILQVVNREELHILSNGEFSVREAQVVVFGIDLAKSPNEDHVSVLNDIVSCRVTCVRVRVRVHVRVCVCVCLKLKSALEEYCTCRKYSGKCQKI